MSQLPGFFVLTSSLHGYAEYRVDNLPTPGPENRDDIAIARRVLEGESFTAVGDYYGLTTQVCRGHVLRLLQKRNPVAFSRFKKDGHAKKATPTLWWLRRNKGYFGF